MVNLSQADTVGELKEAIEGRIQALANVHSLFVASRWIGAELTAIAKQELAPYGAADGQRVQVEGPEVLLEPDVAQAIAVILHELATNAVKYGALSVAGAQIDLKWFETDGRLNLRWSEIGGPTIERPTRKGLGGQIIERMIAQLRGKVSFDWRPEGLVCELSFHVV